MKMIKKIASVLLVLCMSIQVLEARAYIDVEPDDAAYDDIGMLSKMGIIEGVGDDKFMPNSPVNRADFLIMLSKAFDLEAVGDKSFEDVKFGDYFYDSVMDGVNAGIISGRSESAFAPMDNISMQEAAKICVAVCEKEKNEVMQISESAIAHSADSWAKTACDKAATANIIDKEFEARRLLTRADAARMICQTVLFNADRPEYDYERETVIVQKKRGNIFLDTDGFPEIEVNTGYPIIEYTLTDFWGNTIKHGYQKIADGKAVLSFDNIDFGHYYVYLHGSNSEGYRNQLAKTTIAYLKQFEFAPADKNPFGVNVHYDRSYEGWLYDLTYEASLIGVRHIRDQWFWQTVENPKGTYVSNIDKTIEICKEYGIDFFPVASFRSFFYDDGMRPYTDDGRLGYANFVKAYFDTYKGDAPMDLEMYNEWWHSATVFASPAGYTDLSYLKALYEKAVEVVKKKYPDAVLSGMIANPQWMLKEGTDGNQMEDFNINFIKLGIIKLLDELTVHFYPVYKNAGDKLKFDENGHLMETPEQIIEEGMNYFDEKMQEYNNMKLSDIPWSVTETGWIVDYKDFTERNQGTFYPRLINSFLYLGAKNVITYDFLCDGNNPGDKENNYGLLNAQHSVYGDYAARPAYVSYGVNARMINDKKCVGREERDNIYAYDFSNGKDSIKLFNTIEYGPKTIAVETDEPLNITDAMGATRKFVPYNGKVYLTINEDVTYVHGRVNGWSVVSDMQFSDKEQPVIGADFTLDADVAGFGIPELIFEVNKKEYPADEIIIPASFSKDERTVKIYAKLNGEYVAAFDKVIKMDDRYEFNTSFSVVKNENGYVPAINIKLKNRTNTPLYIDAVKYTVNSQEYSFNVERMAEAKEEMNITILPENLEMYKRYDFSFRVVANDAISKYVDSEANNMYAPLDRKTMIIDGVIDEDIDKLEYADFSKAYNILQIGKDSWTGWDDLGGKAWVSYDDDNLYVAVEVKDDVHCVKEGDSYSWKYDSIQVGLYHENYDNTDQGYDFVFSNAAQTWNEVSFYLTEDAKPKMWRTYITEPVDDRTVWEGTDYAIKRNDSKKTTVYECSFPWSQLHVNPKDIDYYAVEIAVNDSDGGERQHACYLNGDAICLTKNRANFLKYSIIK